MEDKTILLVEDNADDEKLTLRALKKNNISNEVFVARNGVEALDYLFGTGTHSGRDTSVMPEVVLLDLKLPKIDGLEVLRQLRGNERTKLLPVVILTSSNEEQDRLSGYGLGADRYFRHRCAASPASKGIGRALHFCFRHDGRGNRSGCLARRRPGLPDEVQLEAAGPRGPARAPRGRGTQATQANGTAGASIAKIRSDWEAGRRHSPRFQ